MAKAKHAKKQLHPAMVGHQFKPGHGNAHKMKPGVKSTVRSPIVAPARSTMPGMVSKAFGRGK